ncbi:MAG: YitT family protein [Bacteroidales bacterium]|nr:YitT family protein [Bacteroidales bacterium]
MGNSSNFKKILGVVNDYFVITLGLLFYTSGISIFILPNEIVSGGVSGMGALVQYATNGGIPISYTYFVVNVVLLLIALKLLGKGFGVKTVYAIFAASLMLRILPEVVPQDFIQEIAVNNGKLLSSIIAGTLCGFGIGVTFSKGGSTGGTDIVALIVNKYRNVPPGRVILILDIFIVGSSIFLPSDLGIGARIANVMYGYIMVAVCGFVVDLSVSGNKQSVQVMIFSKANEEIAQMIGTQLKRGVTILDGQGWYTKRHDKILMVVVRKTESPLLLSMIKSIDPNAFITVGSVMGVYGQGFDTIKESRKKKAIQEK